MTPVGDSICLRFCCFQKTLKCRRRRHATTTTHKTVDVAAANVAATAASTSALNIDTVFEESFEVWLGRNFFLILQPNKLKKAVKIRSRDFLLQNKFDEREKARQIELLDSSDLDESEFLL